MPDFARLRTLWVNGAIVLFVGGTALAVAWALLSGTLALLLEISGSSSDGVGWWVAYAAPLWAPLVFGFILQSVPRALMHEVWTAQRP